MLPILTTRGGLVLAKTWTVEGIKDFDGPKYFTHEELPITDIRGLYTTLDWLRECKDRCVIRGKLRDVVEDAEALPGFVLRRKTHFADAKRDWVMFDVDGYDCEWAARPGAAFAAWVKAMLPAEFHDAAFVWQLSGSAGYKPGLRGHVWFWLRQPMDSVTLRAWATVYDVRVDRSVLDSVQVHYTADPIMGDGVADPVWDRLGFVEGAPDALIDYDPSRALVVAERRLSGMKDPREKGGLIGAFCRAWSPVDVLNAEWFTGRFEHVTGARWTWLDGGGSREGVRVTDTHLINMHNSAPQDTIGRAQNSFDVLRLYQFGHLDSDEDAWAYNSPQSRPSYQAAKALAESLPGVGAAAVVSSEASVTALARYQTELATADYTTITGAFAAGVRADADLSPVDHGVLVGNVRQRIKALQGALPGLGDVRDMLSPARAEGTEDAPAWLSPWVYMGGENAFIHRVNKRKLGRFGFDGEFNRLLPGAGEAVVSASRQATESWDVLTVHGEKYLPAAAEVFEQEGVTWLNAYRHDLVPVGRWDAAVSAVLERHLTLLVPNDWERAHLKQWMAWVARHPGKKCLHAVLIKGTQGDGKSLLVRIMQAAMGGNVNLIDTNAMQNSPFTEWSATACLGVFEELRVARDRYDVMDRLKPLITNLSIPLHAKGKAMITVANTVNYMGFTNHDDGVPVDNEDRRWFVLFSPWRHRRELEAVVGDPVAYWQRLSDAIDQGEAVRGWLDSVDLAGFNPFGAAPETHAKRRMIHAARSDAVKAIQAIIDAGDVVGVSHEAISHTHMVAAMQSDGYLDRDIPKGKALGHMMRELGYGEGPRASIAGRRYSTWKVDTMGEDAAITWLRDVVGRSSGF